MDNYDVVIVGGGMVGLSLAAALAPSGMRIAVLDTQVAGAPDANKPQSRVSAISHLSENLFRRLGVWDAIAEHAAPYQHMSVWEQDSFANIDFSADSVHQTHLGHIIENAAIRYPLWQRCEQAGARLIAPVKITNLHHGEQQSVISLDNGQLLACRLVVGADGVHSQVRQQGALPMTFWDYEHTAIVANVRTQQPHNDTARQVFTPDGPLAFLPMQDPHLCSIVWSVNTDKAEALMALDDEAFCQALASTFDLRLGLCSLDTPRSGFPLTMRFVRQWAAERLVLVGDAAHSIHPLAGQGVNLGLQDVAVLAQSLTDTYQAGKDIGRLRYLRPYERQRKTAAVEMIAAMEGFKQLFGTALAPLKLLRGLGLSAVNRLPGVKSALIKQAMGMGAEVPDLTRPHFTPNGPQSHTREHG
ncbi:FAD-dependent monooxygenase [Aestuariibacter halophilus]|uniref:FAD-dependent monooxygenase n=1 Tax=Fluctibacter halophilus TaxID=226011 RepID=A0ABS8G9K9_9ALTE|nr:FAD-dependent monooxygenase [Aestuariibacter halophilus]MCC2616500.1 FAD-dependent monooxygenase [Aestuariibacter halophilus]